MIINSVIKGKDPQIEALNVTPSTSAQQITATGNTDGYSPVNVSAVTSSIDANIVAGNIKDGVTILGVTGDYSGNTPTGTKQITSNGTHDVAGYEYADVQVPTTAPAYYVDFTKDANGVAQKGSYLMDFSSFTGVSPYVFSNLYNGNTNVTGTVDFSSLITVNSNNACQNMFNGCTGITGVDLSNLYQITRDYGCYYMFNGCTGLTGILDLSSLHNIAGSYSFYSAFKDCAGLTGVNLSSLQEITGNTCCQYAFQGCTGLTGTIDLSSLKQVTQGACGNMFYGCTHITSVDLSGFVGDLGGIGCFSSMFRDCTGITSVNLSNLVSVAYSEMFMQTFYGCTSLTSVDLSKLISITGGVNQMFYGCTSLASISFPYLIKITGNNSNCYQMFSGCTSLASVNIPKLTQISGNNMLQNMFQNCTSLTELNFSGLAYTTTNLNSSFNGMLTGVTGCTVHFPAEWQTTMSSWSNVQNGFGGTNTTVLFDLPNITTLDFSYITEMNGGFNFNNFAKNNYFPNITSVDMSGLVYTNRNGACSSMFEGCTNLTSADFSSLKRMSGQTAFSRTFYGCTGLTNVNLDSLTVIYDTTYTVCGNMFNGCTGLTSIDLSKLVSINSSTACQYMFANCTNLATVDLSSLKYIKTNSWVLNYMFQNCTSLTTVSFPALKTVDTNTAFTNMLQGVTGCTVHFPSNLSVNVTASTIGGTNTTVLKDLPAVVTLTGADTVEYERNPKYDTATALAWRVQDTGTEPDFVIDWTPFYTSGTTDPQVSDTIYSDSACTTPVTTISSIA